MNFFSRRRFSASFAIALASSAGLLSPTAKAQPLSAPPTSPAQLLFSLRALMEVCCREAIEEYRDRLPLTFTGHIRKAWQDWIREDKNAANTPFLRFEIFDAFGRHVVKLLWEESLHHFMQKTHVLTQEDMKLMLVSIGTGHVIGTPWATNIMERRAHDNIFSRLLIFVLEIELHWLVTQTERYRNNPPARFGQIDTPEYEVALRVTRALLYTLVDAVSARERYWRQLPMPEDTPMALKPILSEIAKFYREPSPEAPGAPPPGEPVGKSAVAR
jgi:hypothetical protein